MPAEGKHTRLVQYIVDEVFKHFQTNRRELEEGWLLNYDAFRGKYSDASSQKWRALEGSEWRSKVFIKVTRMKVVAAVAQLYDILFQGGSILPFDIKPTEVPRNMMGQGLDPADAAVRAENMKARITDTLQESQFDRTEMTAILEGAINGMSALKSPVIRMQDKITYDYKVPLFGMDAKIALPGFIQKKYGRFVPHYHRYPQLKVENPSIWNLFWDPEATSPKEGFMIIERKRVSPYTLLSMAQDRKKWDMEAVKRVIDKAGSAAKGSYKESDSDESERPGLRALTGRMRTIKIYECWGLVPNKLLEDSPAEGGDTFDGKETEIFTIIADNEAVLPPIVNPLPGYLKPYHFANWEDVPHESTGVGLPENMRDAQIMMNSSIRCLIDNKALSGNVLMAIQEKHMEPGESLSIYPGKKFRLSPSALRAQDAIQFFSPPDVGRGLLDLYKIMSEVADEESGLPRLQQGMTSKQDPETAYGISRLLENSNRLLGAVIRRIDEGHIESVVGSLYHFLMQTDPDEEIKGDYNIQATGYTSYTDRVTRGQSLTEYLSMMLSDPILARLLKPAPLAREIGKIKDIEVDQFLKTDDELEKEAIMLAQLAAENADGALGGGNGGMPATQADPPRPQ